VQAQQVRHKWANWQMLKDHRKRQTIKALGADRMRINAIRKNDVIPPELKVKSVGISLIL